jgi:hypothetical protein
MISFIIGFYYYKISQKGSIGANGDNGYSGIAGNACNITIPCYKH